MDPERLIGGRRLAQSASGSGQMTCCCKHGNELPPYINEVLDWLENYQLLKKDSAQLSQLYSQELCARTMRVTRTRLRHRHFLKTNLARLWPQHILWTPLKLPEFEFKCKEFSDRCTKTFNELQLRAVFGNTRKWINTLRLMQNFLFDVMFQTCSSCDSRRM
jgi:hypothetical protein